MDANYIDYISTLEVRDMEDSLKDLMRESFDIFYPYLNELYHVEANAIYMNLVCGVSQTKIAELLGVSQYGISKRITAGLGKLSNLIKIPEKDPEFIKMDFDKLFPFNMSELLQLYYFVRTFSMVSRLTGNTTVNINQKIIQAINYMGKYADVTNLKEFISVYIEVNEIKFKTKQEFESKYPKNAYFINSLLSEEDDWESYTVRCGRYFQYLTYLLGSVNYGDYTFKKYDGLRS